MRGFEPGDRVRGGAADQLGESQLRPVLHLDLQQGGQHRVERQLYGAAHLASHQQAVSATVPVHSGSQQCSFWRPMPWHIKVCGSALHMRPRTDPNPSHNSKASSTLAAGPVRNSLTILDA